MEKELLKLNLGCGKRHFPRFVNVDKYGEPELRHDLEVTPWPWEDNSVSKILMLHVLEHIGAETGLFFSIIKEMYR
ncbi:MAG: hypothetical protein GY757_10235, partial [bacterium]|nr:hypothetical protein [bacterium]